MRSTSNVPDLPSGTLTFLFTDIEGSTQLWENDAEAMRSALTQHDAILREAVESQGGRVIKTTGDGIHAVFEKAIDAMQATIAAQKKLQSMALHPDPNPNGADYLKVRMALHTGEAELREGDYYGKTLNRAARIMSVAWGGQILLSQVTAEVVRDHLPENAVLLDIGEHRLRDLVRPERLFQLNVRGLRTEFPPLQSLNAFPNNLPSQLTSFVGRERELVQIKERLASARVLTLIGPGGTGKTRLTLQLAADVLPEFADGVWFVELAPLADPALVLQAIASVLGLREQSGMTLMDITVNYLRTKDLLMILDNCEHLVEACARLVAQFLLASQTIKIIASSREALGISGESVYRVPSLSLPDADTATATLQKLEDYESLQLFIARARAANPGFRLAEKNAASVAQICRRLDGIPLALELAAARLTVFAAEQIAARLDDRFKLLTGGSRTALPRQQTLRALIDWSYDMLGDEERILFRRLSVFADGWTFEAAEALCPDLDLLTLLTQLINKSLVSVEDKGEESRYFLLETVRQYARDKLLESGEVEQIRDLHLTYFHDLAQQAEPQLYRVEAMGWVIRLEAEHDNIRTAIEWGMEKNITAVLEICCSLAMFWFRRGLEGESRTLMEQALARVDSLPKLEGQAALRQTDLIANTWLNLGFLSFSQGDAKRAIQATQRAAHMARQTGNNSILARALGFEFSSRMVMGESQELDAILDEGLAASRASDDLLANGMMLGMFGTRLLMTGRDLDAARTYAEQGLTLLKESGNRWGYTMVLLSVAIAAKYARRFEEARSNLAVCLPTFQEMGDMHRVNMVKSELAHMEREEGHWEKAEQIYRETVVEWQRLGHRAAVAHQLECLAFIAKIQEKGERAATILGAAEALREQIHIPMTAVEHTAYEREIAELRAGMDKSVFDFAWLRGRAMTMEAAIQTALED